MLLVHRRGLNGVKVLSLLVIVGVLVLSSVYAQAKDSSDDLNASADDSESSDEQLSVGAGITPDSPMYFIEDKVLTMFRDDLENREKKIAEVREMVQEGKIEDAKRALESYRKYAEALEKEADPDKKEEAQRSAAAIRNAIKEIESELEEKDKKEFVDDVLASEKSIVAASEIASKIKELCEALSKLDPEQYERTCKTEGDSPDWQIKMDKKLTKEQQVEAEKFFEVMSSCYENPKECECEKISVEKFAAVCKETAPLAAKCEEGDEDACEKMNSMEDPKELLPEHLQGVLDKVEGRYEKAQFDNFAPPECREAKAKTPEECMKVMFRVNAPEECIEALDKGEIDLKNERVAREQCEEIMFEANAPEECVQAGLKNPKECGKLMFKENAPQECIEAGLTGESSKDSKKCEELMRSVDKERKGPEGERGGFGPDCRSLQDAEERLKCYDGKLEGAKDSGKRFEDTRIKEKECANSCEAKGGRWDFTGGNCQCYQDDRKEFENKNPRGPEGERPNMGPPRGEFREGDQRREEFRRPEGEFRGPENREGGSSGGGDGEDDRESSGEGSGSGGDSSSGGSSGGEGGSSSGSSSGGSGGESGSSSGGGDSGSSSGGSDSGSSSGRGESGGSSGGEGGSSGVTGGVIFENEKNGFLSYYFKL